MNRDERIAEILASYFERGETPDAEKLRADHPELAGEIGDLLAALGHFDRAVRPADELPEGVPEQIGDYRILREIGRGGMGVVYEAEQVSMKRRVALKLLSLAVVGAPHAVKRFQREAQAAGRLHHTNIVPIHAMGQHAGHWYYAMELVEGLPLGEVIERLRSAGVRPTERALAHLTPGRAAPDTGTGAREYFVRVAEMFAGVAEALHLAHEEGIVHRDVKPSNLLLDADGTLKIVDFGLARMDAEGPSMTATGDLLGTPAYMSPEQAMAKRMKIDHRTDIYSLGATLYEVITLQPPFRGANLQDLCSQIITKDPALPRRIDQRVPRDLETIVLKAMEKDRDKRYRSAAELARDLRRFADGAAIAARRVGLVGRSWRRIRRHRVRSALAAAAMLLAAGAAVLAVRAEREGELRRNAEYERLLLEAGSAFAGAGGDVQRNEFEPDMTTDASARETLAAATRLRPDRPEAYLLRIYTPGRTYDERLADIDAAHARGALTEASRRLLRAFLLRVRGDTEAAAEERMLAGAAEPKGAADWYAEARLLDADGRTDEALAHLDAVLGMKDASPAVAYIARRRRAQLRLDTGNAAGALEDMQQLIGMGDRGVGTRAQLAAAWLRLGREAEALDAFTSALRLARERNTAASWDELTRALFAFEAPAEWHDRATREELEARARDPDAHEDRALFLARFERFPEAIEHYGRAIELGGASPGNLHMNRGLAHLRIGEAEAALADFDRALELTDKATANSEITYFGEDGARRTYAVHAERLFSRSRALRDLKRWDEQLAALDEVLAREPDHARALADRGTVLANHGKRYADALADFERALELDGQTDGDKARVCLNKGVVLGKLGRPAEALEAWRRAIELNPTLGLSYAYAAQALESTGRVEEALAILTEGIANVPDATSLRQDRGALLQRVGRYEAALREFDDLLARDAGNPLTHCNRGIVLRYLERNDEALTAFERALALDPRREVATLCHLQRAAILDILGRLEESVESYERGLALDPNQPNFWANYALVLDGLGRPGAADAMGRAVALDPGDPRMRWQLAGFLLAEGKRDAAMEQYEAFLRTNPDDARKLVGLALQLAIPADASERERKVALACAQRATTILPSHPEPQRALGAALYRSGEWDQSVSAMERALKGAGDRADAIHHFFLAMALRRMDREDEARAAHRRGVAWLEQQSSAGAELRGLQEESQRLLGAASAEGDR